MRILLIVFLLLNLISVKAQERISGKILDQETGEPIAYAQIKKVGTNRGAITNDDGYFELNGNFTDSLRISFLSYEKVYVPFGYFLKHDVLYLKRIENELATIEVFADYDFLYDMTDAARKNLMNAEREVSKTYFSLETLADGFPVELIECYYNATIDQSKIEALNLKNGRIGMSMKDSEFFASLNTTLLVQDYYLISKRNARLPFNPLQFSKRQLRKFYEVKLVSVSDGVYQINYLPKKEGAYFNARLWINREEGRLVKAELEGKDLKKHPLKPIDNTHHLGNLNFKIAYTFSQNQGYALENIKVDYDLRYAKLQSNKLVKTSAVFLFFDYDQAFHLPHYSNNQALSDYDKIVAQPYNPAFWKYNAILSPSKKVKVYRDYFRKNGVLLNFDAISNGNPLFKDKIIAWSKNRILLDEINEGRNYSLKRNYDYRGEVILSTMYNLSAHIYLDRNVWQDTVSYLSKTLIDKEASFYYLEQNKNTLAMINMYYDLVEIERRNMMLILQSRYWSAQQSDSIYTACQNKLESELELFMKATDHGDTDLSIDEYAERIDRSLGIDNRYLIWSDYMADQMEAKSKANAEEEWVIWYNHGSALLQTGYYQEGLSYLLKAYNTGVKDPWLLYNLGIAYFKLGKYAKGCTFFKESQEQGEAVEKELLSECD